MTALVLPFPNPDEVNVRKFFVEDTRFYVVFAEDEDAAFDAFCSMTEEQASAAEVEGGGVEVYPADQ
jgi:hypothetical protein